MVCGSGGGVEGERSEQRALRMQSITVQVTFGGAHTAGLGGPPPWEGWRPCPSSAVEMTSRSPRVPEGGKGFPRDCWGAATAPLWSELTWAWPGLRSQDSRMPAGHIHGGQ